MIIRSINPTSAKFWVHVPSSVSSSRSVGVIVYVPDTDECTAMPQGWQDVLDREGYIFVVPQGAGNMRDSRLRAGLAVMGLMTMLKTYKNISPNRVFTAGFSGGSRIACDLGFNQADLVRGAILSCGAEFPMRVAWQNAKPQTAVEQSYGFFPATSQECAWAKSYVRFAVITGGSDFRRPFITDIYNNGFKRYGFQARFWDVASGGHSPCSGETLKEAIGYLASGR